MTALSRFPNLKYADRSRTDFPVQKTQDLLPFLALFAFVLPMSAQHDEICSYYGETVAATVATRTADAVAQQIIERIVSVVGLKANFEIREADVPNAAAVIVNNKRYILYNRRFMSAINEASGTNWASISILAHEIGHHLNGHTLDQAGSRPEIELEADEFSGFILRKMGANLQEAQAAISLAASQKGSHTHPPKQQRLTAIGTGWRNAEDKSALASAQPASTTKAVMKPVTVRAPQAEAPIDEKYIAFDVHFNADPETPYYITIRGNLVAYDDESLYVIGRLAESNRSGYRLMLSDKNYNYLYISGDGIINASGEKVGYLERH